MKAIKLYKHFISTNYANIKTKTNDFKEANKQENKTRGRSQGSHISSASQINQRNN